MSRLCARPDLPQAANIVKSLLFSVSIAICLRTRFSATVAAMDRDLRHDRPQALRRRWGENRLSAGEMRLSTLAHRSNAFINVVAPFQRGAKRVG